MLKKMGRLLEDFIQQGRMKLPGTTYRPCYEIDSPS